MSEEKQKQIADEEDKDLDKFADKIKDDLSPHAKQPEQSEPQQKDSKVINIEWDVVPYVFALKAKIKKAIELELTHKSGSSFFIVQNGSEPHNVTEDSCDCKDWEINGNSKNPCKHILRVKYTVEELTKMLEISVAKKKELKNGDVIKMVKKEDKKEGNKKEKSEIAIIEETEETLTIPDLTPALAELGKIKVGGHSTKKTPSGFRIPEKWDCFKIGSMMKDEQGDVVIDEELTTLIGENCKELDISLCFDIPALNFPNFYAAFTASKLQCRGNGRVAYRRQADGELKEIVCNRKECPLSKDKKCKPYAKLSVILEKVNRVGGVYVYRTTSYNSIRNLISSMAFIKNICGGILAGIPLKLRLMPITVTPNEVNKKVIIYVVNIEYAGTLTELKEEAQRELHRRSQIGFDMKALEDIQKTIIAKEATDEVETDAEAIESEFYVAEEGEE